MHSTESYIIEWKKKRQLVVSAKHINPEKRENIVSNINGMCSKTDQTFIKK